MAGPGRQRTFDLIPTTLVDTKPKPPRMTSKAAKKLYQKTQNGTRISKAEQKRLDDIERKRILKEHEQESNARKAKAARNKKLAKAEAEKQERKKQGLPEPSRFVRASQPTIAGFVRPDKRSCKEMNAVEETEDSICDSGMEDEDEAQPPAKRVMVVDKEPADEVEEQGSGKRLKMSDKNAVLEGKEAYPDVPVVAMKEDAAQPTKQPAIDLESDDEFGDFPPLTQSVFDKIDSSAVSAPASPEKLDDHQSKSAPRTSPQLPAKKVIEDEFLFDEDFNDLPATQLLSEAAEAISKTSAVKALEPMLKPHHAGQVSIPVVPKQDKARGNGVEVRRQFGHRVKSDTIQIAEDRQVKDAVQVVKKSPMQVQQLATRSALQERPNNMPPPKLPIQRPPKFATPTSEPATYRQTLAKVTTTSRSLPNMPPSGTQAFLENNIDDFDMSPSQQVRELLDDDDFDIPSNIQVAKELGTMKPPAFRPVDLTPPITKKDVRPIISKFSPARVATAAPVRAKAKETTMRLPGGIDVTKPPEEPRSVAKIPTDDPFDDGFICTQDLILTPQDLEELSTPSRAPPAIAKKSESISKPGSARKEAVTNPEAVISQPAMPPPTRPVTRLGSGTRPRFFHEKEDDIYQAVLHESKKVEPRKPAHTETPSIPSVQLKPEPKQKRRSFFQEKDEDVLHAVLHKSKISAAQAKKPRSKPTTKKPPKLSRNESSGSSFRKDFDFDEYWDKETKARKELEEKEYEAALRESRRMAGMGTPVPVKSAPVALNNGPSKSKRNFLRVVSGATDYGDEDFDGWENELFALP